MLLTLAAVAVTAGFLKPIAASVYKAVRVAFVSSKSELATQLGKLTTETRKVETAGADGVKVASERVFEVADEAFVTVWRRLSVFLHVLLTQ
jgi:hypothetical protein